MTRKYTKKERAPTSASTVNPQVTNFETNPTPTVPANTTGTANTMGTAAFAIAPPLHDNAPPKTIKLRIPVKGVPHIEWLAEWQPATVDFTVWAFNALHNAFALMGRYSPQNLAPHSFDGWQDAQGVHLRVRWCGPAHLGSSLYKIDPRFRKC